MPWPWAAQYTNSPPSPSMTWKPEVAGSVGSRGNGPAVTPSSARTVPAPCDAVTGHGTWRVELEGYPKRHGGTLLLRSIVNHLESSLLVEDDSVAIEHCAGSA